MEPLDLARQVLEEFQYFASQTSDSSLLFEDNTVLGAIYVFPTVDDLLSSWSNTEQKFLQVNSSRLSRSGKKAWNIYSVFLTSEKPGDEYLTRATRIEENFEGTRKVVQAGVRSMSDVKQALYPLIPIQHHAVIEGYDPIETLRSHLGTGFPDSVLETILGEDTPLIAFRTTVSALEKRG